MDLLLQINVSSSYGCITISIGFLAESIGRMDVVDFTIYARKCWCSTWIVIVLGFMAGAQASSIATQLSSNSLHSTVGEAVLMLYPRNFIYLRRPMIVMVLSSVFIIAMYSLSVEFIYISVWSFNFHITVHPKYNATNCEGERNISESSIASYGKKILLKSAWAHNLTLLSRGGIYMPSLPFPFR